MSQGAKDRLLWYRLSQAALPYFLLGFLAFVSYGRDALDPALQGDAWGELNSYLTGTLECPTSAWSGIRWLTYCESTIRFRLFGLNLQAHVVATILMVWGSAVLVMIALRSCLPEFGLLSLSAAACFLVYPSCFTQTWLVGNIRSGILTFLAACCLLIGYWRDGSLWKWLAGLVLLCLSFLIYEVSLGLAITLSLSGFVLARGRELVRRVTLLVPAGVAVIYAYWRWAWQVEIGGAFGHNTARVALSPETLVSRLMSGYRINLQWAWNESVRQLIPALERSGRYVNVVATLVLGAAVLACMLLAFLITRNRGGGRPSEVSDDVYSRRAEVRGMAVVTGGGLLALGAGYIPIVTAVQPTLGFVASRANILPAAGASVLVCGMLWLVGSLVANNRRHAAQIALAGLVPLVAVGAASQWRSHMGSERAWATQKDIWHQMFRLAPDFVEGTDVVLIISGYESVTGVPRPVISGPWGFGSALNALYGKNELAGVFAYGTPEEVLSYRKPELSVMIGPAGLEFRPDETVVFVYEWSPGELRLLPSITAEGRVIPLGPERIVQVPTTGTEYRWLVE